MPLYVLLWLLVFNAVTFVNDADVGKSWMDCDNGLSTIHISLSADEDTLAHELVHANDCRDDWLMNGSYGPYDPLTTYPYCLRPVEMPACVAQFNPEMFLEWLGR